MVEGRRVDDLSDILLRMGNDLTISLITLNDLSMNFKKLVEYLDLNRKPDQEFEDQGSRMRIYDRLIATIYDKHGNIKDTYDSGWSKNGITYAGFAEVAALIGSGLGGTPFGYVAIGTGTAAFDPTQTALGNELVRKQATVSRVTTSVSNDTTQWVASFSSADGLSGTSNVSEGGVFNAATGGTMLCRQTFTPRTLDWDAGDTFQLTWKVQVTIVT